MNSDSISDERRPYSSSLREEQAEQTRERILTAVAQLLRGGDIEELSFASVARQAGVSVPTVYRYFPSRKALFDGIDEWLAREMKAPPFPDSWENLVEGSPALFAYYESARDLFHTAMVTSLFRDLNQEARRGRDKRIAGLLAHLTDHLDERDANAIHGLMRLLFGFEGYSFLSDRFGVTAEEASRAIAWATRTLSERLAADRAREGKRSIAMRDVNGGRGEAPATDKRKVSGKSKGGSKGSGKDDAVAGRKPSTRKPGGRSR